MQREKEDRSEKLPREDGASSSRRRGGRATQPQGGSVGSVQTQRQAQQGSSAAGAAASHAPKEKVRAVVFMATTAPDFVVGVGEEGR